MSKAKIQIVEDERIVAEDMRQFLESVDYEVCGIAKDSAGALRLAEEHSPDLILMDIVIRGEIDGIDTAAMIRERFGIPVIYLTAYSQDGVIERAKPTQPLAYLVKPFKESSLLSTLEMALHKAVLDAQVAESRELFHTTLKSIGDGVISTDASGDVVFMNRIAEELTGWSHGEGKGQPIGEVFNVISSKTEEPIEVPSLVAMKTGVVCSLERGTLLVRKDGSRVAVDDSGAPIHNAEGDLSGSVLVFRDVTAEQEREKKLFDYREQLEDMVESRTVELERRISLETTVSKIGSALIQSKQGEFDRHLLDALRTVGEFDLLQLVAVLPASSEMSPCIWSSDGVDEALCEKLCAALLDEGNDELAVGGSVDIPDCSAAGGHTRIVAQQLGLRSILAIGLGGSSKPEALLVLGSASEREWPADDRSLLVMLGSTIYGVAQRERNEMERIRLVEELQQSRKMEAIGKLSGGIAHDFNNMLVPIIGYSESILKSGEAGSAGDEMAAILKAAKSAADLTKQLLAFSRKQILLRKPTNISNSVDEMRGMLDRLLGEDIEMTTRLEAEPWCVMADRGQLDQVVLNLCVNSRDAMPRGGRLELSIENVTLGNGGDDQPAGDFVKLSVRDSGTGIPTEVLERMFEPFYTSKGPHGTGLGLSVVLGIVEQHGGWIDIDSSEGMGSTFNVFLPADREMPLPQAPVKKGSAESVSGAGRRILLVEDEPSVMAFVCQMLASKGYSVVTARCRQEAFEELNREDAEFDLLFTDAMLPDGTGMDVINHAESILPDTRTLLSSGYSDDRSLLAQAEARDIEFLSKPYSIEELLSAVEKAMGAGLEA